MKPYSINSGNPQGYESLEHFFFKQKGACSWENYENELRLLFGCWGMMASSSSTSSKLPLQQRPMASEETWLRKSDGKTSQWWVKFLEACETLKSEVLPSWNQHRTWKWIVGIRSFPFGFRPNLASGYVSFREGMHCWIEHMAHVFRINLIRIICQNIMVGRSNCRLDVTL